MRQQLKRLENCAQRDDCRLTMKSQLIAIVAAVLQVGCASRVLVENSNSYATTDSWIQLFNGRNFDGWRENSSSTSLSGKSSTVSLPVTGAKGTSPRLRNSTTSNFMRKPASAIPLVGEETVGSTSVAHRIPTRNRNFLPAMRRNWTMETVTTPRVAFTHYK